MVMPAILVWLFNKTLSYLCSLLNCWDILPSISAPSFATFKHNWANFATFHFNFYVLHWIDLQQHFQYIISIYLSIIKCPIQPRSYWHIFCQWKLHHHFMQCVCTVYGALGTLSLHIHINSCLWIKVHTHTHTTHTHTNIHMRIHT